MSCPVLRYTGLICITWSLLAVASAQAARLTEADLDKGVLPKAGDEVILSDFARLAPKEAISNRSEPGKWWLRPYREEGGRQGTMLMTVQRDLDHPERCLVPAVTYPLKLDGWYQVWIATYRGAYGGGVDVRLSDDALFTHMDPQQVALHPKRPKPRVGAIVEISYKPAADLKGQSLVFQQPFGTYESFHWGFCEASLAYVRLVRLSDAEVKAFQADQARTDRRIISFDDDNFSRYWMWGGESADKIRRIFEPMRYHDVDFIGLCLGTTTILNIPTPYSDLKVNKGARLGDRRMRSMYTDLVANGVDLLQVATDQAHQYGIKLLPTLRMSSAGIASKCPQLQKYRLKTCPRLDFAYPQVRDYYVKMIRHILEKYPVDGFILDFTRHCIHFNADEPNKKQHMNEFSAAMRAMVDDVAKKKGKKVLLVATFSENDYVSGFLKHYLKVDVPPEERLQYQGIDVADWISAGYYDIIMPEGPNIEKYIAMTRGTSTRCYPRWEFHSTMYGQRVGANIHDPTPEENLTDRPPNPHNGPLDFEAGWAKLRALGADGLYLFNNSSGWPTLRRMGHVDEVGERVQRGEVYGLIEGPKIQFLDADH